LVSAKTVHVGINTPGAFNAVGCGTNTTHPCRTLVFGLSQAASHDVILVAPGTYNEFGIAWSRKLFGFPSPFRSLTSFTQFFELFLLFASYLLLPTSCFLFVFFLLIFYILLLRSFLFV
jgi:hypothetical protein